MGLRPLDGETGTRRKRDSELNQKKERAVLKEQRAKSDYLRRNGRGTERRGGR